MADHQNRTVLVIDDEEKWLQIIRDYLVQEGFMVYTATDGTEAIALLREYPETQVVLLDWMMPGMSGLDVCREIRKFSNVPILFLTARSEEMDRIIGLELGADDYITKPFSLREMVTRIRVVLRRVKRVEQKDEEILQRGPLRIDLAGHRVWLKSEEVSLTPTEFKLLVTLAQKPGRTFSRLQLLEIALGEAYAGYERTIDSHIYNLRKKIEPDLSQPKLIQTVFGVGYKFGDVS